MISASVFYFVIIILAIAEFISFHNHFRRSSSMTTKDSAMILIKIALNLYINLGRMYIHNMLKLPVHEHTINFFTPQKFSVTFTEIIYWNNRSSVYIIQSATSSYLDFYLFFSPPFPHPTISPFNHFIEV